MAEPDNTDCVAYPSFLANLKDVVISRCGEGVFQGFVFALVIGTVASMPGLVTIGGRAEAPVRDEDQSSTCIILIVIWTYLLTLILLGTRHDAPAENKSSRSVAAWS